MNINLTWDLFILVFFGVVIAYSFIIGKDKTIKLIIASYLAMLAADGLGNLLYDYILAKGPILRLFNVFSLLSPAELSVISKVVLFIGAIVLISIRGGFEVDSIIEKSAIFKSISTFVFGFLSAGLIISTILVFTTESSFLEGGGSAGVTGLAIYRQSEFVRIMINNYNMWFSLPAIAFIIVSFIYVDQKN